MKSLIGLCGVMLLVACGDDAQTPADAHVDVDAPPDAPIPAFVLDPSFGNVNGSTIVNGLGDLQGVRITLLAGDSAVVSGGLPQYFSACRYLSDGHLDAGFGGCISRDWFGTINGQVAADGDAVFVAANAPLMGPRVNRVLATGMDDTSFGSSGSITLMPPSGFGSDAVVTTIRRMSDGSYVTAGTGTYLSGAGGPAVWAQPMQANGTTTSSALIAQAGLGDVLDGASSPTFVLDNGAAVTGCPTTACGTNEVCRFDACVATPTTCATSATCGVNQYCHQSIAECLPDDVGFFRTHVVGMSGDLATTVSDRTFGNRNSGRTVALTDGSHLLLQRQVAPNDPAGMWKITSSGTLDRTFGSNGLAAAETKLSAAVILPDGRIVAATADATSILQRYTVAGVLEAMTTDPTTNIAIHDIALTSDGKLLVAGVANGQSLVVQRFVMNL